MFRLTMLPADDGDCLLVDYGTEEKQHHILIDGGRKSAYRSLRSRLETIDARGECIDLLVLTHIDADHIEGLLPLIADEKPPVEVRAVWYNGFDQLSALELYGPGQADAFSAELRKRCWPWNPEFGKGPVVVPDGAPIELVGPGGIEITLLTPSRQALASLRANWLQHRRKGIGAEKRADVPAGLELLGAKPIPTPYNIATLAEATTAEDGTVPNGSSIAFVAEYEGRRLLLAADAHPFDLVRGLRSIDRGRPREIHLAKIPHHGSKSNVTSRLVREMRARRFAISTNGGRHGHPDPEAIARLIHCSADKVELFFNYRSSQTEVWGSKEMIDAYGHTCVYATRPGDLSVDV